MIAKTVSSQVRFKPAALSTQQNAASTTAYSTMPKWLIWTSLVDEASGLRYVLYTSKVKRLETAISSADVLDVTATDMLYQQWSCLRMPRSMHSPMNSRMSISTAPPLPARVIAVAGEERPAAFCAAERGFGYVGKLGLPVNAAQPKPIAVANPKGMPYHAIPPRIYALTDVSGRDAIARCQYA
ncbi:hypothetical protein Tdes44962_MAKER08356 [Teratosphaeria destructans]|uniref:Uncharacterized protein n=1 Tax=Teratosphaeria destructans TaxID=418781 RepID=A0A9W7W4K4_9PEZI|nr:hypothetical protein Tdes44962_MAKER08356 [Teratosphaeria destructans]